MSSYIISIDGGGTKTFGVLYDENGVIIDKYETGFSNFNLDYNITKINLEETIGKLSTKVNGKLIIVIGVSGESGLYDKADYISYLNKKYQAETIIINDGQLALNSLDNGELLPLCLFIGGTGSYYIGKNNNEYYNVGGFGHLLGDVGGAYNLVISAFKHIIENYESSLILDDFSLEVFKALEIIQVNELKKVVYNKEKNEVASKAIIITNLFNEGNLVAKKIIDNEIEGIVKQVLNLFKMMNINSKVRIGFVGGLIKNVAYIRDNILLSLINNGYEIDFVEEFNPVDGGYFIAKKIMKELS